MQNKQDIANAKRIDDWTNIAPRQKPPMVTRVSLTTTGKDGGESAFGIGVITHPPRYVR